jgi:chromosome segregation ATPase
MNRQELNALLEKLHAELAASPQVDDALKQSLQALDQDIQRVLSQASTEAAATASTEPGDEPDINALAQALEAKLEAGHPYLVNTLRELMDRLGKMGI